MKKLLTLLFAVALTFSLSAASFAQDAPKKDDTKKEEKAEKKAAKKKAKKEKKAEKKADKKTDDMAK
jgi:Ni/Co efflux regulator RcnB